MYIILFVHSENYKKKKYKSEKICEKKYWARYICHRRWIIKNCSLIMLYIRFIYYGEIKKSSAYLFLTIWVVVNYYSSCTDLSSVHFGCSTFPSCKFPYNLTGFWAFGTLNLISHCHCEFVHKRTWGLKKATESRPNAFPSGNLLKLNKNGWWDECQKLLHCAGFHTTL